MVSPRFQLFGEYSCRDTSGIILGLVRGHPCGISGVPSLAAIMTEAAGSVKILVRNSLAMTGASRVEGFANQRPNLVTSRMCTRQIGIGAQTLRATCRVREFVFMRVA
mmetsp:Transcript_74589/g.242235  ORF Transcript_74589/g.242235 Transcript_74589/m.242235 type:complete len:108 (+) Transcript_74589:1926-2249(+)